MPRTRGSMAASLLHSPQAGGLAPNQISGLVAWWRADSGCYQDEAKTVPVSNGSKCYAWEEKVVGRTAVRGWLYGEYVKWYAADASLNSRPVLEYEYGSARGQQVSGWTPVSGAGARTVVAVGRNLTGHATSNYGHIVSWGAQSASQMYALTSKTGGSQNFGLHYWLSDWSTAARDDNPTILVAAYDGAVDHFWRDGGSEYTNTVSLSTGSAEFWLMGRIGDAEWGFGRLAELCIYDRFLSADERDALLSHLSEYYAIPV